ncbi:MAG: hypothetical protein AVDCRST_MAG87-1224, partial [uncultured Thermomicrobiales bacterium]
AVAHRLRLFHRAVRHLAGSAERERTTPGRECRCPFRTGDRERFDRDAGPRV